MKYITQASAVVVLKEWVEFFRPDEIGRSCISTIEKFSDREGSNVYFAVVSGSVLKVGYTRKNPKFRIQELKNHTTRKRRWTGMVAVVGAPERFEMAVHMLLLPWIHRFTPKSREYFKLMPPVDSLLARLELFGEEAAS